MKNWTMLPLILALALFLAPLFPESATAQSETMLDTTLESGITAGSNNTTDNATQTKAWWLRLRGVPGKGILTAPGLQKPFNSNWQGFKSIEKKLKLNNQEQTAVTEQTQNNGENQTLKVRKRTMQESEIQQQAGTTQQAQNHGAAKELKVKGNKNKP
jgi:hypothetical protein